MPRFSGSETLTVDGTMDVSGGTLTLKNGQVNRAWLQETENAIRAIRFTDLRVWDDLTSLLPSAAASDDLGLLQDASGNFGTDAPVLQTSDSQSTSVTQYARFFVDVDNQYVEAGDFKIRIIGGMKTTISDGTATVDLEVYRQDRDGGVGSDICATDALSINTLANANKDFTITPASLTHGDVLDCRIKVAITDAASATAVIGEIVSILIMRDIRG